MASSRAVALPAFHFYLELSAANREISMRQPRARARMCVCEVTKDIIFVQTENCRHAALTRAGGHKNAAWLEISRLFYRHLKVKNFSRAAEAALAFK